MESCVELNLATMEIRRLEMDALPLVVWRLDGIVLILESLASVGLRLQLLLTFRHRRVRSLWL